MRAAFIATVLAALLRAAPLAAQEDPSAVSADVAAILRSGTEDTHGVRSFVVASPEDPARVLKALGLQPLSQALVFAEDGTAWDVVETSGGTVRFDVTAFVGKAP